MHDGVDGKQPLLEKEEMKRLILDLKKRGRELALRKSQEQIVKNAQESGKFLAENGKKPGISTTESGLQYKILKEGTGTVPGPEDTVRVNYRGMFIDFFRALRAGNEPQYNLQLARKDIEHIETAYKTA